MQRSKRLTLYCVLTLLPFDVYQQLIPGGEYPYCFLCCKDTSAYCCRCRCFVVVCSFHLVCCLHNNEEDPLSTLRGEQLRQLNHLQRRKRRKLRKKKHQKPKTIIEKWRKTKTKTNTKKKKKIKAKKEKGNRKSNKSFSELDVADPYISMWLDCHACELDLHLSTVFITTRTTTDVTV